MVVFGGVRRDEGARDVLCCFCEFIGEYWAGNWAVMGNGDEGRDYVES